MKNKKLLIIPSFAIAAALVAGPVGMTSASEENGNGMMNGMMNGEGMGQMMEAMNSPEAQEMINSCTNFMGSQGEKEGRINKGGKGRP